MLTIALTGVLEVRKGFGEDRPFPGLCVACARDVTVPPRMRRALQFVWSFKYALRLYLYLW